MLVFRMGDGTHFDASHLTLATALFGLGMSPSLILRRHLEVT